MQRHTVRHQRKITKLTAAFSRVGSKVSKEARKYIRYMKLKRKRYKKAIKNMKIEIATHMMDVVYAGISVQKLAPLQKYVC